MRFPIIALFVTGFTLGAAQSATGQDAVSMPDSLAPFKARTPRESRCARQLKGVTLGTTSIIKSLPARYADDAFANALRKFWVECLSSTTVIENPLGWVAKVSKNEAIDLSRSEEEHRRKIRNLAVLQGINVYDVFAEPDRQELDQYDFRQWIAGKKIPTSWRSGLRGFFQTSK